MPLELWRVGVATLPLVTLLVGLLVLGWSGTKSGVVALVVAVLLAAVAYATPTPVIGVALYRGVVVSLHILYIIWAALLLYRLAEGTGAIRSIGAAIGQLTTDPVWQLLIIGFAFSSFLQGVAGFGVPIAVTAPLLIGLGFPPLQASAVPLLGHAWSVSMGDMASSFQALRAVTALSPSGLGNWIGLFLSLAAVATGFAVAHLHAGWPAVRSGFARILALGTAMGLTHLALSRAGYWTLASFGAGMVGLIVGAGLARFTRRIPSGGREDPAAPTVPFRVAFLPYYTLIAVVLIATFVAPLRHVLEGPTLRFAFPETATGLGWRTGPASFALPVFGHPGALLLYAVALTVLLYRRVGVSLPQWGGVWQGVKKQGMPTTYTILLLAGVAMVMTYSGMTFLLARGLTGLLGSAFPLISPFIGLLGTIITGSNTNSNLLFGVLQRDGARLLAMDPVLVASLQSAGGSVGSMLAPAKVVLGTATTGLAGKEGLVMRVTLPYAVILTAGLGVLGFLLILLGR